MTIDQMLKIHEDFKSKGLSISEEDMLDRLNLREDMITEASNLKAKNIETKMILDKDKAKRTLELKSVVDEKWKGLTEKTIEWNLKIEFFDREIEIVAQKATADLLQSKADTIIEYVNVIKLNKKISF